MYVEFDKLFENEYKKKAVALDILLQKQVYDGDPQRSSIFTRDKYIFIMLFSRCDFETELYDFSPPKKKATERRSKT